MKKSRKSPSFPKNRKVPQIKKAPANLMRPQEAFFILDSFSANDIDRWQDNHKNLYEFYWNEYSYYAHFRTQKAEFLRNALLEKSNSLNFKDWYRCVDSAYLTKPLFATGSRVSLQGGRFNIGQVDSGKFPSFSALYLAENEETAFKEKFQIKNTNSFFDSSDFGLRKKSSFHFFRINGRLDNVIDIRSPENLKPFLKQIKKLTPPNELIEKARKLGLNPPDAIRTLKKLMATLSDQEWSTYPTAIDIPSNSQIFGLIAKTAGLHGVLYKSKFQSGSCLAIFPENFINSESMIELSDITDVTIPVTRVDKNNCALVL